MNDVAWAIKSIQDYYSKFYGIEINQKDKDFLNAVLQVLDSASWKAGYDDAKEDNEVG